jgi:hypothetical protein
MSSADTWALFKVVGLPVLFFAAIALFSSGPQQRFSSEHRAAIERIAIRICTVVKVQPCPVVWSGKNRWLGTLEPSHELLSFASLEELRMALPPSEWSESSTSDGKEFRRGNYVVTQHVRSGRVVITSAE